MKYALIIVLLAAICLNACESKKDKYSEARIVYVQAIAIHDEVMPYMGKIIDLQKQLKSVKDTLTNQNEIDLINQNLQNLENAHNSMMNWMRTLTPVPADDSQIAQMELQDISSDEMIKIQEKALFNIKEVKKIMDSSIENAQELINKYKD